MSEIRFVLVFLFGFSSVLLLNAAPHPAPQNQQNIIDQFNPANFANQIPFLQGNKNNGTSSNGTQPGTPGIPFVPEGMWAYFPGGMPAFGNMVAGGGNTNIPFGDLLGGNSQWQNFFGGAGNGGAGSPPKKD